MVLDKAGILAAKDLKREEVPVPEWGEGAVVLVKQLSAMERMAFFSSTGKEENKDQHGISLALTHFIVNEDGSRLFEENEAAVLAGKSLDVLVRIFDAVKKLNGMEATEEITKN